MHSFIIYWVEVEVQNRQAVLITNTVILGRGNIKKCQLCFSSVGHLKCWSVNLDAVSGSENTKQISISWSWSWSWSWSRSWRERERSRRFDWLLLIIAFLTPEDVLTDLPALLFWYRLTGLSRNLLTFLARLSHTFLPAVRGQGYICFYEIKVASMHGKNLL